jgi:hypothetical protein
MRREALLKGRLCTIDLLTQTSLNQLLLISQTLKKSKWIIKKILEVVLASDAASGPGTKHHMHREALLKGRLCTIDLLTLTN